MTSVNFNDAVGAIVEKQQTISSRRRKLRELEVDDNTCRICGIDDRAGFPWIGCDHEPQCFGGAGWYHMPCVKLDIEPEGCWLCPLCTEDDEEIHDLSTLLERKNEVPLPAARRLENTIYTTAGNISRNCTVIKGKVLFLENPVDQSEDFISLGIRLHDNISDLHIQEGEQWEPYGGLIDDLNDRDNVRFIVTRGVGVLSTDISSRDVLACSTDARSVGCARDTYYRQDELPPWLSADEARPIDVQKPHRKGMRCSKYNNPNAKVSRGSKRKLPDDNLVTKHALAIVSKGINVKIK
jgi:hypothetical protein